MHCDSDKTQPMDSVIIPNNAELGGRTRGTIRSKRFHGENVKSAAVLRMDVPQDRLEFRRFARRDSKQVPHFVRPDSFAGLEVNVENANYAKFLAFHALILPPN